jgi:hypothetical protein
MATISLQRATVKTIFASANDELKALIKSEVPDIDAKSGWVLSDISSDTTNELCSDLGVELIGETQLIEVVQKTASGDEAGHGFYLHRRGGSVTWYAAPTKKGKAVRLVPVFTGSEAEQHLIDLGYAAI